MELRFNKQSYLNLDSQPLAGTTISNWFRVLRENRYHVSWPFIPRAIYVSLMVAALAPRRIKEKKFFSTYCSNITVPPPVFIIGHWRSGTTYLHYLMGKDPALAYVSTMETLAPNMFLTREVFLQNYMGSRLPKTRPMDNLEMHIDLPYEDEYALANMGPYSFYHGWYFPKNIVQYFKKYVLFEDMPQRIIDRWGRDYINFLKKIAYKNSEKRILLKSLVNTAKIQWLLRLFPDAQFIHIYRNPYDVYKSTWKLYKRILPLFAFQHVDDEKLDRAILLIYHDLYTRYLSEKSMIPSGQLFEISYESFIKKPLETLKKLYDYFGFNGFTNAEHYFQQYIQFHHNYKKEQYILSASDKKKVVESWDFMFDTYGYSK